MKVKFVPQNVEFEIKPGESVMHVAQDQGLYIKSVCKGVPSCAECRVRVVEGDFNVLPPASEELGLIGTGYFIDRRRLSCQLKCFGDITVDLSEQITKQADLSSAGKKLPVNDRVEQAVAIRSSDFAVGEGDDEAGGTAPRPTGRNSNPRSVGGQGAGGRPSRPVIAAEVRPIDGPSRPGRPLAHKPDAPELQPLDPATVEAVRADLAPPEVDSHPIHDQAQPNSPRDSQSKTERGAPSTNQQPNQQASQQPNQQASQQPNQQASQQPNHPNSSRGSARGGRGGRGRGGGRRDGSLPISASAPPRPSNEGPTPDSRGNGRPQARNGGAPPIGDNSAAPNSGQVFSQDGGPSGASSGRRRRRRRGGKGPGGGGGGAGPAE